MAKQGQAVEAQADKKSQPKTEPAVVTEITGEPIGLNLFPGGLIGATGDGAMEAQAARLGDTRLQSAQRRALALHIGQAQGNRHLQRAIAAFKRIEQIEPYQPNNDDLVSPVNSIPKTTSVTAQRREGAPESEEAGPNEAEKAVALAKAAVAEQQAGQANAEGQNEVAKSQAEQASQQQAGQTAQQEVMNAKAAAPAQDTTKAMAQPGLANEPQGGIGAAEQPALKGSMPEGTSGGTPVNGAGLSGGSPPTTEGKAPISPEEDPAFQATVDAVKGVSAQERSHAPAKNKAGEAQAAAVPPAGEVASKAQAAQVGEMAQAETPPFDAAGFKAKLMDRIAALAPKTAEEADNFKKNNQLGGVKGKLQGQVKQEQTASQAPLAEKTTAAPNTSGIEPKPVTPLAPAEAGPAPGGVGAEGATPKPKGQVEVEAPLRQNSQELDEQMAEADVTEEQLAKSNEPEFQTALKAKQEAQTDAQTAPQAYRQAEQAQLGQAQAEAATTAQDKLQAMHGNRGQLFGQVEQQQGQTKSQDEQARAKVAADIESIYANTKSKVEGLLKALDDKVARAFDEGAAAAKKSFEDYVEAKMEAYKERRYGGWLGWAKWLKDKVAGMPPEVNAFYEEGRRLYLAKMDAVINNVVTIIEASLTEAKAEIARGQQKIQEYVTKLPENLQQVGQQAAQDIQGKFEALEQDVNNKQDELINTLAQKYQDNLKAIDARIEEMKAANSGLINKALNVIGGVIKTILQLKNMLLNVLARAGDAIGKIIKDPIGFLGNLISGVKQGLQNFVANIGTHLQEGLMTWLFGAVAEAGIQLPESLDLKGILTLVMQVLGLTWENIRARAVALLGEEVVAALEKGFEIFMLIKEQGLGALWEYIQGMLGDLQATVMDGIKDMVITQVIQAGIQWLLGVLGGPAGAFIKAAKAIYDIVMWFVNNGSRVAALVNAVLDSVTAIAGGNVSGAAKFIEESLAKAIPVVIGFLASLLGLGDMGGKIRGIIQKVQAPINKAIDWVIGKAKAAAKKIGRALGLGKEEKIDPERDAKVKAGLAAIDQEEAPYLDGGKIEQEEAEKVAATVKNQHPIFQSIKVIDGGERWDYEYVIQRAKKKGHQKDGTPGSNIAQNRQFDAAVREIERQIGRTISKDERRRLHDAITGQNYGFWEIVEEGLAIFSG